MEQVLLPDQTNQLPTGMHCDPVNKNVHTQQRHDSTIQKNTLNFQADDSQVAWGTGGGGRDTNLSSLLLWKKTENL